VDEKHGDDSDDGGKQEESEGSGGEKKVEENKGGEDKEEDEIDIDGTGGVQWIERRDIPEVFQKQMEAMRMEMHRLQEMVREEQLQKQELELQVAKAKRSGLRLGGPSKVWTSDERVKHLTTNTAPKL